MTKSREPGNRARSITILGVEYPSIKEAAIALGLHQTTLGRRLRDGWQVEEAIGRKPHKRTMPGKALRYRGKAYPSIKALAESIGVRPTTFALRLAKGRSVKAAVEFQKRPPKHQAEPITFKGRRFPSKKALAEHYGTDWSIVGKRVKNGWTMGQALGLDPAPPRFRDYAGHAREQHWKQVQVVDGRRLPAAPAGAYRLYLITNTVTELEYVGITTNDLGQRLRGHLSLAKKGRKSHLYNAMRHYGAAAFKIKLLRNDARDYAELQDQEVAEIARRNTIRRGYNTGLGGSLGTSRSIRVGGEVFPSRSAAAARFGITVSRFVWRLGTGWTPEQAAGLEVRPDYQRRPIEIGGTRYQTLTEAATALGLEYKTVAARITARGWTLRQALGLDAPPNTARTLRQPLVLRGKKYASISAAARAHELDPEDIGRRLRRGASPEEALRGALAIRGMRRPMRS